MITGCYFFCKTKPKNKCLFIYLYKNELKKSCRSLKERKRNIIFLIEINSSRTPKNYVRILVMSNLKDRSIPVTKNQTKKTTIAQE